MYVYVVRYDYVFTDTLEHGRLTMNCLFLVYDSLGYILVLRELEKEKISFTGRL